MGNSRAPLEDASATASGSGLTEEEREAGRDTNCNDDTTSIDASIELEEAPGVEPALRNRVMTPERPAAVRKQIEETH